MTFGTLAAWAQPGQKPEVRMEQLVDAGAAPRKALNKALDELEDRQDEDILRRTLYGIVRIEQVNPSDIGEMMGAAQRRLSRTRSRYEHTKELVDLGIYARNMLEPVREELADREKTLELAQLRAKFLKELEDMVRAEQQMDTLTNSWDRPMRERFDGNGQFTAAQLKRVVLAFESQFSRALPVSANGDTILHRSMGLDHRGRIDVAVNPDSEEGQWLRRYLETERIPYLAFRGALAGAATGPHIHIGPPSPALRIAD